VAVAPAWSATPTVPPPPVPPPGAPPEVQTVFAPGLRPAGHGVPVRPRRSVPTWVLVLLYVGAAVPFLLGVVYTVAAADPHLANQPGSGYSDAAVQSSATTFAVALLVVFAAQLIAALGLTFNQPWGRVLATFVCLAWMVTLIGIPVSVIALTAIWRRAEP
jgi:hypothetical protein